MSDPDSATPATPTTPSMPAVAANFRLPAFSAIDAALWFRRALPDIDDLTAYPNDAYLTMTHNAASRPAVTAAATEPSADDAGHTAGPFNAIALASPYDHRHPRPPTAPRQATPHHPSTSRPPSSSQRPVQPSWPTPEPHTSDLQPSRPAPEPQTSDFASSLCYFHARFGPDAQKCRPPCSWPMQRPSSP